jgi:hypothetical protein
MANGGYWHSQVDWRRVEAPLLALDSVVGAFASRFAISLTRNHKDWPERSLAWGGQTRKLIQIFLADEKTLTFNIWLCASQDRGRERYWKQEFAVQGKPVAEFEASLESLLVEAKAKIDSWTESQLEHATSIG